jgi:Protein of unknown function (DUF1565)
VNQIQRIGSLSIVAVALVVSVTLLLRQPQRGAASIHRMVPRAIAGGAPPTTAYYVNERGSDAGDGSREHPWATLQRAAQAATAGAIVHVSPGTYVGAVKTTASGTSEARIIFRSDVRWRAKVTAPLSYVAWENDGDNVDIEGFDITGDGNVGLLNLGSRVRIIGNTVHHIPAKCTSNGGAGINNANYSAHDNDVIGNLVYGIGEANTPCPRVHGIYHANVRGHVWNNIVYGNQGYGIHLWHTPMDVVVANNLVFHNGAGGITLGAGDAPGGVIADGMVVTNNIVVGNGTWRPGWAIVESGRIGNHNFYSNNIVWRNSKAVALEVGRAVETIDSDPRLVRYREDGSGDYHLAPGSPAIQGGVALGVPSLDFDGRRRPAGQAPDIGPYCFSNAIPVWPWVQ